MLRLLLVVGTRPNYIKVTQFKKVAAERFKNRFDIKIVHTGQHFDKAMAEDFFKQLDIYPDYALKIPQGSANNQIGEIMIRLEDVVKTFKPHLMIVPGDVNSTLAAALTAHKMGVPLAHLESGLRSFDRSMPEEINRILVDEITDMFFVTEQSGLNNLLNEGKDASKIHMVGNTMIDTLVAFGHEIESQTVLNGYDIESDAFILMTMHRPATVDHKEGLLKLMELLQKLTKKHKVVFPMHPRTKSNISKFDLEDGFNSLVDLVILEPMDYLRFQNLIHNCKMILTDSGGIQEESTFKQIPCITLRPNTERPSTTTIGSNTLLDFDNDAIMQQVDAIDNGNIRKGRIPEFWDGEATYRILKIIASAYEAF